MAGLQSKFLNGAQLEIVITDPVFGPFVLAYTQALSFSHNMRNAPVGGIGSYSQHTLEPLQYSGQGSMVVTRYAEGAKKRLTAAHQPANMQNRQSSRWASGNGLLHRQHFNPVKLLVSQTFDITVRQRNPTTDSATGALAAAVAAANDPLATDAQKAAAAAAVAAADTAAVNALTSQAGIVYVIYDCRMTNFSFNLTTAGMLNETVSFVCRGVKDFTLGTNDSAVTQAESIKDQYALSTGNG